jgi:uncharacterized delta-60 repeat protein
MVLLGSAVLGGAASGAPGDSDPAFGTGGFAAIDISFDSPPLSGYDDLVTQPDGKIVVAGTTGENSEVYEPQAVVARFNADGTVDQGFGKKGRIEIQFPDPDFAVGAVALAAAPDGAIWVATSSENVDLARLTPAGALDPGFSGDGKAEVPLPGIAGSNVNDLALDAAGKLVLGGSATVTSGGLSDFMALRFTPDGVLDPSFSGDGIAITDLGASDTVNEIAVPADGSVVLAGRTGPDSPFADSKVGLVRLTPAGVPDPAFDGDGMVSSDVAELASGVAVDAGGGIFASVFSGNASAIGTGKQEFEVARFTAAGQPDSAFGTGGIAKVPFSDPATANDVAIEADGSLVAAGTVSSGTRRWLEEDFAVAKLDSTGKPDPAFAGDGRRTDDLRCDGEEEARSVALDGEGRILLGGPCDHPVIRQADLSSSIIAVTRYEKASGPADEDADGVADAADRCPNAYGPKGKGKLAGCANIGRTIVRFEVDKRHATGTIRAGDAACEAGQRVSVLKEAPGRDRVVARGRSDPDAFDLKLPAGDGEFYSAVSANLEKDGGQCEKAISKKRSG